MKTNKRTIPAEFWAEQWRRTSSFPGAPAGYGCAATWNAMAEKYGGRPNRADRDDRVIETIAYLKKRGVRFRNARVLDIGCGPGKYARAFARRGAEVVCVDIAEKMIGRLQRETGARERKSISPVRADWRTLDLEARGFANAFDLVFANMTPAIAGPDAFMKIMRAGRRWCWFRGWAGPRHDPLRDRLHRALFGPPPPAAKGNFFYAWNIVRSSGYRPARFFSKVQWTGKKTLDESVRFYTAFFGPQSAMPARELSHKIATCLAGIAVGGFVENTVRGRTGAMLWTVQEGTRRS
jgi:SAM-dependent methyltransferase